MSCTNVSTTIPPTKNHQLREFSLREPISRCFLHCVTNRRAYDDSARKMEQHRKLKKNRLQPSFGQTTVKVKVVLLHPGAQKVLWTNSMFFNIATHEFCRHSLNLSLNHGSFLENGRFGWCVVVVVAVLAPIH